MTNMSYETLEYNVNGQIAIITINRSWSVEMSWMDKCLLSSAKQPLNRLKQILTLEQLFSPGKGKEKLRGGIGYRGVWPSCSFYEVRQIFGRD